MFSRKRRSARKPGLGSTLIAIAAFPFGPVVVVLPLSNESDAKDVSHPDVECERLSRRERRAFAGLAGQFADEPGETS